jgi:ABC-2 type transport system ATP-binding protein
VIHHGRILYDGDLERLVQRFASHKTVNVELERPPDGTRDESLERFGEVVSASGVRATLRIAKDETPGATARLLTELPVKDLTVEDPPIEEVIERVFAEQGP